MNEEIDNEYKNLKRYADAGSFIEMNYEQFQESKQEAHWDIAWQIFDEVNQNLNQEQNIDLNCLELEDALAITKQKIYDVANEAQKHAKQQYYILNILVSPLHIYKN